MKSLDALLENVSSFAEEIKKIDDSYDFFELDGVEGKAVRMLQLMEVQIGDIGAELYSIIKKRRASIAMGRVAKSVEIEPQPKKKPTRKKKGADS